MKNLICRELRIQVMGERIRGDALSRQGAGITSSRFSSSMEQEYGDKVEPVIYLENLENLLVISKLMEVKEKSWQYPRLQQTMIISGMKFRTWQYLTNTVKNRDIQSPCT